MSTSEHLLPASRQAVPGSPEPRPEGAPLRSPGQIERDIEARRERLQGTITTLADRLAPAALKQTARDKAEAKADEVRTSLRERLGALRQTASERLGSTRETATARLGTVRETATARLGTARGTATARFGTARGTATARLGTARETATARLGAARGTATARLGTARGATQARLTGTAEHAKTTGSGRASQVRDLTTDADGKPRPEILAGAAGVVVAAAVVAVLVRKRG